MLDIRFIRENVELVKKSAERKGYKVDVDKLLELDKNRRGLLGEIEKVRAERNEPGIFRMRGRRRDCRNAIR